MAFGEMDRAGLGALAGARQLEVTINGIGERAGNAALEEVVMALKCRGSDVFDGLYTAINTKHILKTSKMVEEYTNMHLQPHKALVGANTFVHESGIHQDGWLKHKATYEIISPESIGLERSNEAAIALGKLSGRQGLRKRLEELGYRLKENEVESVFWKFKAMSDKKKRVTDADIRSLVSNGGVTQVESIWKLSDIQVTCGTLGLSTTTVRLHNTIDGSTHVAACSVGSGSMDPVFKAVNLIVKEDVKLVEYTLTTTIEGVDVVITARAVICRENNHSSTHSSIAEGNVQPTFCLDA